MDVKKKPSPLYRLKHHEDPAVCAAIDLLDAYIALEDARDQELRARIRYGTGAAPECVQAREVVSHAARRVDAAQKRLDAHE